MATPLPPRKKFGSNFKPQTPETGKVTDDPWLKRAVEAYDTSTSFIDTNFRKDWDDSIAHWQNKHMPRSKYYSDAYKYRSKLFRPKTRSSSRAVEAATSAAFFSQIDVVSIEPQEDKNPLQMASALLRHELLNYRLSEKDQIPWFQICVGAMQDAQVIGVVASKQFWDFRETEVEAPLFMNGQQVMDETGQPAVYKETVKLRDRPDIKLYPIENIRFDPAAEWTDVVNTSPYFIGLESMRIGDVKILMEKGIWEVLDDSVILTARNACFDSTRKTRGGDHEDEKDPRHSQDLSDFDLVWVHENFMKIGGMDYQFYTLGTVARLTKPRPLKEVYLHNRRPFVVGACVIETHKAVPDSPTHLAKSLQKEANEIVNTRLDNVKLVLNKRWFAKRGKQIDLQSLVRNAPGSVTMMNDPQTDVVGQEFNDVTGSSYAEQDRLNVDMDELLGSFSAGSIATNRKLGETVGGLNMLRGTSNSMAQYVIRVFSETWVEKVLRHVDELEQHYESDIDLLVMLGRRANIAKYGIDAITEDLLMAPAKLMVNVANSAMDPTVRLELFTYAMRTYAEFRQIMPPDIDPEPVKAYLFGLLGFRDASRFTADNDNPELVAAQQMIQQLQQALESKMAEIDRKYQGEIGKLQAKFDQDRNLLAAEMHHKEILSQREMAARAAENQTDEETRLFVTKLQEATKVFTAKLAHDEHLDKDETQRFIAMLGSETDKAIARMRPAPSTQ